MNDTRRITLVSRNDRIPPRGWDFSTAAPSRIIPVDSLLVLRYALAGGLSELHRDVERVVLDRTCSAAEYLTVLSSLPDDFTGDVLLITQDDSGFLSSLGRGSGRLLYALSARDLGFYLEAHGLVSVSMPATMPAVKRFAFA
jgi:hypothetical protein